MSEADAETIRNEVLHLRQRGALTPAPVGLAVFVALVLAIVEGNPTGFVWATLLLVGVPSWLGAVRLARARDAHVIAKGDAATLAFLRGRLSCRIALNQWAIPVLLSLTALLCSAWFALCAVLLTEKSELPYHPLLAAELLLVGGTLLTTTICHCLVTLPARRRRLAQLGGQLAHSSPPEWLIEVARELSVRDTPVHAGTLWHEATGVPLGKARRVVRDLLAADAEESERTD